MVSGLLARAADFSAVWGGRGVLVIIKHNWVPCCHAMKLVGQIGQKGLILGM